MFNGHLMIAAIDFDHTIHDNNNILPNFKLGQPMAGAKEALTKMRLAGHTILIHTCRANDGAKAVRVVEDWMKYFQIPFDAVWQAHNGAKPVADYYIDDKGLRFTTWQEVMVQTDGT